MLVLFLGLAYLLQLELGVHGLDLVLRESVLVLLTAVVFCDFRRNIAIAENVIIPNNAIFLIKHRHFALRPDHLSLHALRQLRENFAIAHRADVFNYLIDLIGLVFRHANLSSETRFLLDRGSLRLHLGEHLPVLEFMLCNSHVELFTPDFVEQCSFLELLVHQLLERELLFFEYELLL